MGKLTKAEELELAEFHPQIASTSSNIFIGTQALIVSISTIVIFYGIFVMNPRTAWPVWTVSSVVTIAILVAAYRKATTANKDFVNLHNGRAIEAKIARSIDASEVKISRIERDTTIRAWKADVVEQQALYKAVCDTNVVYFIVFLLSSLYLFRNLPVTMNNVISTVGSAGAVTLYTLVKHSA